MQNMDTDSKLDECPICLDLIDDTNIRNTSYKCCQYKMHHMCFMDAVINNKQCPICRSKFELPKIYFINMNKSIRELHQKIPNIDELVHNLITNNETLIVNEHEYFDLGGWNELSKNKIQIDSSDVYFVNLNINLNKNSISELNYILSSSNCFKPIVIINTTNHNHYYRYLYNISKNNINIYSKSEIFDLNPINKYYKNIKEYNNHIDNLLCATSNRSISILDKIKHILKICFKNKNNNGI